ncbi:MAG: transcription termination factor Rho [Gemmatimonadota bacterium]|nr:transcription termination factor Rho [Gemmatimonadota bacterium]MDP6802901.1 transcription termination factor Rho [Gemmatimonadota bacterium]MDP7031429.1 transcription termination factor Rho [Gemmatimonadota bacterium]
MTQPNSNQRSRRSRSRRSRSSQRGNSPKRSGEGSPQSGNAGGADGNRRGGNSGNRRSGNSGNSGNSRNPSRSRGGIYDSRAADGTTRGQGNTRRGNGSSGGRRRSGGARKPRVPIGEIPALKLLQQGISIDPFERLRMETTPEEVTTRVLDLVTPIGRGQRCLIVAPPMAGKTTLLINMANAIGENHPDIRRYVLLVDERPEEVTHFRRNTTAEVRAASSDMSTGDHIQVSEACVNEALEHVLKGEDVVLLLDSITRLARAYNTMVDSGGRTLSGGLDSQTMLVPRQIFGSARKIEDGGSLTIVATALIDTGSRMDEVIFQEFKGTGNMELFLSRELFTKRIFPCVDIEKSGTRKEEKLENAEALGRIHLLRRHMTAMKPHEAMSFLLELLSRYPTNEKLLSSMTVKR